MGCGQSSEPTAIEPLGTDYKVTNNSHYILGNFYIFIAFVGHILQKCSRVIAYLVKSMYHIACNYIGIYWNMSESADVWTYI